MKIKYYLLFLFFAVSFLNYSQTNQNENAIKQFSLKVVVKSKESNQDIKDAEVFVNGRQFRFNPVYGYYKVFARVNDELMVSHPDFETVYQTIKSDDEFRILVEGFPDEKYSKIKSTNKEVSASGYLQFLDSAKIYKEKDIDKSLSFIEKALENSNTRKRNAATYKTLADIYLYWKQYDLAVNNYKLSLQIDENNTTKIELAKAQYLLKKYEEAIKTYQNLQMKRLSNFEKILVNQGLGDVYFELKNFKKAREYYQTALKIANANSIKSKITDLNSKLASVYAAEGDTKKAETFFNNSMRFASQENVNRTIKEEEKKADFLNDNRRFDDEITLRKKTLSKTENKTSTNEETSKDADSITSQKINYKIGTAYILKEEYEEAIPFLEESRKDAKKNKDIVVEKDATRKISEVFANLGKYDKALENYEKYVTLVDTLYNRKEQEIQQIKRFSKKISENQNRIASLEKDQELADSKISLAFVDQKLSEESNRRQRIIIYSLFGGVLLLSLLAYFMYRNNKQQKLANNLLALKSMRSQMNPHFIFNALNSVNSFIAVNDERNANRYLSEFSALMRAVLENSDEDFIPLEKEIELLELYVKLEHNRFKDKFDYTILVDENINLEQFSIPPMLLQPYIENAIWHGLRYKTTKGNLEISIDKKDEETIQISIVDDGIGRQKSQELKTKNQLKQKSKGMSTIKNRIEILNSMYKDKISVQVSDVLDNGEGTKVELQLKK